MKATYLVTAAFIEGSDGRVQLLDGDGHRRAVSWPCVCVCKCSEPQVSRFDIDRSRRRGL